MKSRAHGHCQWDGNCPPESQPSQAPSSAPFPSAGLGPLALPTPLTRTGSLTTFPWLPRTHELCCLPCPSTSVPVHAGPRLVCLPRQGAGSLRVAKGLWGHPEKGPATVYSPSKSLTHISSHTDSDNCSESPTDYPVEKKKKSQINVFRLVF